MKFNTSDMGFDPRKMPTGSILVLAVRYTDDEPTEDTRGRTNPKVYEYAFIKAAGVWHGSGSGKVPQAAGWGAIERWLERDGRDLVRIDMVTGQTGIWPPIVETATNDCSTHVMDDQAQHCIRCGKTWKEIYPAHNGSYGVPAISEKNSPVCPCGSTWETCRKTAITPSCTENSARVSEERRAAHKPDYGVVDPPVSDAEFSD